MMKLSMLLCTLPVLGFSIPSFATTYQVSGSGEYGSVPNLTYVRFAGTYSFSIYLDSTPAVKPHPGSGFYPYIYGASYTVNGVTTSPNIAVYFRSTASGGGLFFCFTSNDKCAINDETLLFVGQQLFTWDATNPTLLPGSYTPTAQLTFVNGGIHGYPSDRFSNITIAPVAITPEPSGSVLLGTGVLGLYGATRRRGLQR